MAHRTFQSTPAHERATPPYPRPGNVLKSFNPRPLASGRRERTWNAKGQTQFQSTPARERATTFCVFHHLRGQCFNPRPLASGRRRGSSRRLSLRRFQSTPARERATFERVRLPHWLSVSIHARSRAGDNSARTVSILKRCFNPRPLASGRPCLMIVRSVRTKFQSTPARERATPWSRATMSTFGWFQSTPARERATPDGIC